MIRSLRLGTRGSKLALKQAEIVKERLCRVNQGLEIEIVTLVSQGDLKQGTPLADLGDKKDWIAGLEEALIADEIDFTVNSSKDVPLDLLSQTKLLPILEREFPADVLIMRRGASPVSDLSEIPLGVKIGTASLRRQAILRSVRPDLEMVPVRGNITTRLERLNVEPDLFGIVLAYAGIKRLELADSWSIFEFPPEMMVPAVNQGILACQFLEARKDIEQLILSAVSKETLAIWSAEREVIRVIEADCRSAVGVLGTVKGGVLTLVSVVSSLDGRETIRLSESGSLNQPEALGQKLGNRLLGAGAKKLLLNPISDF
jgi:hydroxymethylbilane synthase